MEFGMIEKLGHVVEVDAIRDRQKMHLSSAYIQILQIVILYVKIM